MIKFYFIQSRQMDDESKQGEKENSPQSSQVNHIKYAEVSAVQALAHVNRSHLSHVKDPGSSADQPLLLGCGVFGRCYKMYYRGMPVAVNQFNKHLASESDVIKEASVMKQLDHPCFPYVYGICVERKPYLLVLQFCNVEGKAYTLHQTLQSQTYLLESEQWFGIILQLLQALKLLHSNSLIHRDIKGDNILITYKNTKFVPVITDFGKCIRKQEACIKVLSKEEQVEYRQKYKHIAPEIVAGTHLPSYTSDIYSLGLLLRQIAYKIGCKSLLSLSESSQVNNPQFRASLEYLTKNIKSVSSQ